MEKNQPYFTQTQQNTVFYYFGILSKPYLLCRHPEKIFFRDKWENQRKPEAPISLKGNKIGQKLKQEGIFAGKRNKKTV